MACNISNLARHTCIASIDLTNFYKRHSIQMIQSCRLYNRVLSRRLKEQSTGNEEANLTLTMGYNNIVLQ